MNDFEKLWSELMCNKYDNKSGLFKYIDINDSSLFNSYYCGYGEISINNPVFTKKNGETYCTKDTEEFTRLEDFLGKVRSRKIERTKENLSEEELNKEMKTIQIWLFQLYCLYSKDIRQYQTIQTGKANPGKFQYKKKACLNATQNTEKIRIIIRNGLFISVDSYSTRYFPIPSNIINSAFRNKIKKSPIASRFDINEDEDSELIFSKGIVFSTLKGIIIETLETYNTFSDYRQGKGGRDTFTHKFMRRLTGLYSFIIDYDLYILENKIPTFPEEFICKLLFREDVEKDKPSFLDTLKEKLKNFRNWEESGKTTFPNPIFP